MSNIYFFDPRVALESAQYSNPNPTQLQTYPQQVCFYNGESFNDMPFNCIAVPINDFYNFFLTTTHTIPEQINFDGTSFDDATKQEITTSIINTLTQAKNARVQIVVKVLQASVEPNNAIGYLFILFDYLEFIDATPQTMEIEVLEKLLVISLYITQNSLEISSDQHNKLTLIYNNIMMKYSDLIVTNIKVMHLHFSLETLIQQRLDLDSYFEKLTLLLNDLPSIVTDYKLVTHVFRDTELSDYLQRMQTLLFKDNFFTQDILLQKIAIYKYYFLTNLNYGRGESYRGMYNLLKPLFLTALEKGLDELAFFLYTPLQMSWNGTAQTQEEMLVFNNEIERPLENFIANTIVSKYQLTPNTRSITADQKIIKVAFLQERIINYSINKVFTSLLQALKEYPNARFEFSIYNLNFMEFGGSNQPTEDRLKAIGFNYIDLHQEYVGDENIFYPIVAKALKIRQRLISDEIDIIIGMHSRPEYNFLFTSRVSPKQLYWSHGNYAYNLENIDANIKHGDRRGLSEVHLDQTFLQFPDLLNVKHLNPDVSQESIDALRSTFSDDCTILGTIGRLNKINSSAYLDLIITLMQKNPKTIYLACGSGDASDIQKRVHEAGLDDRWFFPGHVDTHLYGHIIDIWPNTFPHSQGLSTLEYMAKGNIVIQMITTHFSTIDMVETPFETNFQKHNCSVEDWEKSSQNSALVTQYLESNFFTPEDIKIEKLRVPALLYAPTLSKESYQAKLQYLMTHHLQLKDDINAFSEVFTYNRWLNTQATAQRFTNLMQTISGVSS